MVLSQKSFQFIFLFLGLLRHEVVHISLKICIQLLYRHMLFVKAGDLFVLIGNAVELLQ